MVCVSSIPALLCGKAVLTRQYALLVGRLFDRILDMSSTTIPTAGALSSAVSGLVDVTATAAVDAVSTGDVSGLLSTILRLRCLTQDLPVQITTLDADLLPILARYAASLSALADSIHATTTLEALERGTIAASDHPTTGSWIRATYREAGVPISPGKIHDLTHALTLIRSTGLTRPDLTRHPDLADGEPVDAQSDEPSDLAAETAALPEMPPHPCPRWITGNPLRDAVAAGQLPADLAGHVATCLDRIHHHGAYHPDDEHVLIDEAAAGASRARLNTIAEAIIDTYGRDHSPEERREHRHNDRDLTTFTRNPRTGMWHATLRLDDLNHATVHAALTALSKPIPHPETGDKDPRTPGQRRADALIHLADLATTPAPGVSGTGSSAKVIIRTTLADLTRAHPTAALAALSGLTTRTGPDGRNAFSGLAVTADRIDDVRRSSLDELAGVSSRINRHPGSPPQRRSNPSGITTFGDLLDGAETAALACAADLTAIVTDSNGQPLNVGRAQRLATPAQRIALIERDVGCTYPGCGLPAAYTDAHHLTEWALGGTTDLANLCLLCRTHHTSVHRHQHTGTLTPTGVHWTRHDGTPIGTTPRRQVR